MQQSPRLYPSPGLLAWRLVAVPELTRPIASSSIGPGQIVRAVLVINTAPVVVAKSRRTVRDVA